MRTSSISREHPMVRRADDVVLAWVFRLTLEEAGVSAFADLIVRVPEIAPMPLTSWGRQALDAVLRDASQPHPMHQGALPTCPKCEARKLHELLDHRIGVEEKHDFDLGSLAP